MLQLKFYSILETKNATTPMVPVYSAEIPPEDTVFSDNLEQGDSVVHAKYGNGIVEKMIKYGNKTLYSINFDNVGRRLLDPTVTEIKKAAKIDLTLIFWQLCTINVETTKWNWAFPFF